MEWVPLNTYMPKDLKLSFQMETLKEGKTMARVIRELMAQYLKDKKEEKLTLS